MANVVVAGMQWGDEGKGKIVDLLCPAFDGVVRYQGGHNAGHTVKFRDRHFKLHLIPSGICHEGMDCVLGNGMVIAPDAFLTELESLRDAGIDPSGRLFVSDRATVILPLHAELDQAREVARGKDAIGTTSRGIGPAYETKAARVGLRLGELTAADLETRLGPLYERLTVELERLGRPTEHDLAGLAVRCREWGEALAPYLETTEHRLHRWVEAGKSVLFEGAQGALLDVDFGTFPFVTSSNATVGGAATGSGVPPTALDGVVGILKAYTSRVGAGPFPTELTGEMGEFLRSQGNEYGTTTGRPRRCGWLDVVAARYARRLNGVTGIALTKLDVLDEVDEIRVATAYRVDGETVDEFPADRHVLDRVEPVYETFPGWHRDTTGILEYEDLPREAKDYVEFVEAQVGAPAVLIATGPRREETIVRSTHPVLQELLEDRVSAVLAARGGSDL